jgi:hypothetical protein
MKKHLLFRSFVVATSCLFAALTGMAADAPKPLRALLVTGGCCHEYGAQKDILKKGIEARANVVVDIVYSDDTTTKPPLPIYGNPDYANGYDLVIHDECAADMNDPKVVEGVLKPHRDGLPGVNLHCAMHSYRIGDPKDPVTLGTPHGYWFEYLGLQSCEHYAKKPIAITFTDKENPIVKGFEDWTTIDEEHYNNVHVFDTAHPLAHGKQVLPQRNGGSKTNDFVVVWTNEYGPNKTRVFSTTIGHQTETVSDPRYLDLVTRGVLWATGHLNDDGTPAAGYGPKGQ